uniref:Serine/threonine-protein kinase PLK n=1 Tax=Lepisosteus oculatus TaxID=7918 RepID=W5MEL5_LEPOC
MSAAAVAAKAMKPSVQVDPKSAPLKEVPDILVDTRTKKRYLRGRFLGKGGFAKCYEITDMDTKEVFAGKVVPKSMLLKPHQKEKMSMEITIHKSLNNAHVVGFHGFFEDEDFVYVVLEICRRRSLLELHKRRKAVTEPEARYYMRQTIVGCQYLHNNRVIHRDLKLGNLFLNDEMEVKIGDFGLATKIEYDGERKKTLCGTPNYIAPEVLCKKGHSFEVDIWSLGCILYTLLVGKPPFETSCLKETYIRIKKNEYTVPRVRGRAAVPSCSLAPPSVSGLNGENLFSASSERPEQDLSKLPEGRFAISPFVQGLDVLTILPPPFPPPAVGPESPADKLGKMEPKEEPQEGLESPDCYLNELLEQLSLVNAAKPSDRVLIRQEEAEDPACIPIFWISKWVDYSDKYGLGYQLCDNSVGVLFNDSTRLIMYNDGDSLQYIERNNSESYLSVRSYPAMLTKKILNFRYRNNESFYTLAFKKAQITNDGLFGSCQVNSFFRHLKTSSGVLSSVSLLLLFEDHTKLILCPLMGAVTYIDEKREFRTYKLSLIEEHGCCRELASRLRYARTMVEKLLACKSTGLRKPAAP